MQKAQKTCDMVSCITHQPSVPVKEARNSSTGDGALEVRTPSLQNHLLPLQLIGTAAAALPGGSKKKLSKYFTGYFSTVPKELFFIVATFSSSFVHQNLFQQLD